MSSNEMLRFSEMELVEEENLKTVPKKIIENEPLFTLIEDPLNMHRSVSNETGVVSEMPILIDKENFIVVPGQGKAPVSLLHVDTCEELAFWYLFSKRKFGCSVHRDIPVSIVPNFNQF